MLCMPGLGCQVHVHGGESRVKNSQAHVDRGRFSKIAEQFTEPILVGADHDCVCAFERNRPLKNLLPLRAVKGNKRPCLQIDRAGRKPARIQNSFNVLR